MIVDSSAKITYFPNALLRTNLVIYEIDAVVCAERLDAQYSVGTTRIVAFKTVCVEAVLAQKAYDF